MIKDGRVFVRLLGLRVSFPDTPANWIAFWRALVAARLELDGGNDFCRLFVHELNKLDGADPDAGQG